MEVLFALRLVAMMWENEVGEQRETGRSSVEHNTSGNSTGRGMELSPNGSFHF